MGQYNDAINTYEHLMSEMKENGNYDVGKKCMYMYMYMYMYLVQLHVHVHVPGTATCA